MFKPSFSQAAGGNTWWSEPKWAAHFGICSNENHCWATVTQGALTNDLLTCNIRAYFGFMLLFWLFFLVSRLARSWMSVTNDTFPLKTPEKFRNTSYFEGPLHLRWLKSIVNLQEKCCVRHFCPCACGVINEVREKTSRRYMWLFLFLWFLTSEGVKYQLWNYVLAAYIFMVLISKAACGANYLKQVFTLVIKLWLLVFLLVHTRYSVGLELHSIMSVLNILLLWENPRLLNITTQAHIALRTTRWPLNTFGVLSQGSGLSQGLSATSNLNLFPPIFFRPECAQS